MPALTLSVGTDASSCRAKVLATPPALAVKVAACAVLTEEIVAVKLALAEPEGTVTDDGTATAVLLLESATANPLLAAAAFNVTVQMSVPAPVIEPLAQLSPLSDAAVVAAVKAIGVPSCHRPDISHNKVA
ncbi:MAG TPA: hypothetical protein VMT38_11185 [Terracidiphilus sp.]|nr:hypothetical protein [Terracidiphilus sp.]